MRNLIDFGWLSTILMVCVMAALLFPLVDIRRLPTFNSDSAIILHMIADDVPLAENLFFWRQNRSGSLLFLLVAPAYDLLPARVVLRLISVLISALLALGIGACARLLDPTARRGMVGFLSLGLFLWAFGGRPESTTFEFATLDIAHRPELLVLINGCILVAITSFDVTKPLPLWGAAIAILACWVSDFGFVVLVACPIILTLCYGTLRARTLLFHVAQLAVCFVVIVLLKWFSPYSSQYGGLVTPSAIGTGLPLAMTSLGSLLHVSMWVIVGSVAVLVVVLFWRRRDQMQTRLARYWMVAGTVAVAGIVVPILSEWVHANGMHPRYFALAVQLLLCVTAAGGAIVTYRLSPRVHVILTAGVLAMCVWRGYELGADRPQRSAVYVSGTELVQAGCEGVVGPYWNSYVYKLGGLAELETTVGPGQLNRSASNDAVVLGKPKICRVAASNSSFSPVWEVRGHNFRRDESQATFALADGMYVSYYHGGE